MSDWKIARKGGTCGACQRSFEEDEPHLSLLFLAEDEPARRDMCQTCFAARAEAGEDETVLWWWRTHYRSENKRGLALNLEAIEALFIALEERAAKAENSTLSELRYILCLILMRKRRLKIERIVRGKDGEAMLVRRPRRKESLRVAVHDFTPERTDQLRGKLVRLFDSEEADLAELESEPEVELEAEEAEGAELAEDGSYEQGPGELAQQAPAEGDPDLDSDLDPGAAEGLAEGAEAPVEKGA